MEIYLDNLKNMVVPDLLNAYDNLIEANSAMNRVGIPNRCLDSIENAIRAIPGEISGIIDNVADAVWWVYGIVEKYYNVEQANRGVLDVLVSKDADRLHYSLLNGETSNLLTQYYVHWAFSYDYLYNGIYEDNLVDEDGLLTLGQLIIHGQDGEILAHYNFYTETGSELADYIYSEALIEGPSGDGGSHYGNTQAGVPSSPEIQGPDENENSMDERLVNVQEKIIKYANDHPELGLTEEEIRQAISKIHIMNSDEEFKSLLQQNGIQNTEGITEFIDPKSGDIYLPPNPSEHAIIHAVVHNLGDMGQLNGIDEAMTEWLASQIDGVTGSGLNSYSTNVKALDDIKVILDNAGYDASSIFGKSYYMNNSGLLAKTLNDIMEDETFYSELEKNMNIASGRGDVTDQTEISQAKVKVEALVQSLKDKLEKK